MTRIAVRREDEKGKGGGGLGSRDERHCCQTGGPQAVDDGYSATNGRAHRWRQPYRDVGADEAVLVGFNIVLGPHQDSKEMVRKGLSPSIAEKKARWQGRS